MVAGGKVGTKINFTPAMLFAIAFIVEFLIGGVTGIFLGASGADIYFHDTYFVVGHFHLIMGVAAVFAMFAGTYYWFPKMFGRYMNEFWGKVHFWGTIIGFNLVFIPLFFAGAAGDHRRIYSYAAFPDLAKPELKGKVCTRSGSHPYNLSLGAALIQHIGTAKTEEWARGLVANFARAPKGGDTDQIKAVAAGECGVALVNSYYLARMFKSTKPEDQKVVDRIGIVWPNQSSFGTHINISGGGMLKTAPHKEAAVKFLEYLASPEAQDYFANGNNEWPVVAGVKISNRGLEAMGKFKADTLPVGKLADTVIDAQKIYDRAGFR